MYSFFEISLDGHAQAEIKDVLNRIKVGEEHYSWSTAPNEIKVKRGKRGQIYFRKTL